MHSRRIVLVLVALLACLPRPASASGFVNLGLGVSFASPSAQPRPNLVADVGWLAREPIGVELDISYAPKFFKNDGSLTENSLTSVMGNVIVAGFDRDRRGFFVRRRQSLTLRPFISGGFGLISETVATAAPSFSVSNHHLGVNVGIGLMAVSRRSFGMRAEVRYVQDLVGTQSGNATGIDFGSLHFVRASLGIVFAF